MAVNIGPKIGIDGEKEYRKQINDLITQQKTFSAEMRELESSFDSETSAMEKNRKKGELLEKSIKNQEKQVEELEKGLEAAKDKYGENATQTQKWKQAVSNAKTELNKMRTELSKVPKPLSEIGKSMQNAGKKMKAIGDTATKYVTAPLVGIGAASIAAFNEVDTGMDKVAKATGATGKELEGLQQSVKNIATTIPTSFEEAGTAIGEVNTKFGLSGQACEDMSTKFLKFAKINDMDVQTAVDGTQKVMAAFGLEAEDADDLLDAMNKTGQKTGISMDSLQSSMVKNASALEGMGLNAYQAADFLGQVETSGANTETVMSGLQKALVNAAEDGKTLPEALGDFQDVMNSTATDQEKLNAAVDLFGQKAGPAIYEACKQGSLSFESLSTDAKDYLGSVETTFDNVLDPADELTTTMNSLKALGSEVGEALLTAAAPAIEDLGGFLKDAADKFADLDENQKTFAVRAGVALAAAGPVMSGIGRLTEGIGGVVTAIGNWSGIPAMITTMLTSPVALAALGVGGLIAALNLMDKDAGWINEDLQNMITSTNEAMGAMDSASQDLTKTLSSAKEELGEINGSADVASELVTELEKLESQTSLTAEQQGRMRTIVGELNGIYPELGLEIDSNTGKLNKNTKEIKAYIEQQRKMKLVEAYQKAATKGYEDLAEAHIALDAAQKQQSTNQEVVNGLLAEQARLNSLVDDGNGNLVDSTGAFVMAANELDGALLDNANELAKAEEKQGELNTAVDEAQGVYDEAETTISAYEQAATDTAEELDAMTASEESNTEATEANTEATSENAKVVSDWGQKLASAAGAAVLQMSDSIGKWSELYTAAKESIEGQLGLFEEWEENHELTFSDMLHNQQTQIDGTRKWGENMKKLTEAAAKSSDPNMKRLVKYFADGGVSLAGELDTMVSTMENDSESFNQYLAGMGELDTEQSAAARTLAYINNDFKTGLESGFEAANTAFKKAFGKDMTTAAGDGIKSFLTKAVNYTKNYETETKNAGKIADGVYKQSAQTLINTTANASTTASTNMKNTINNTALKPAVSKVDVPPTVTGLAKKQINDGLYGAHGYMTSIGGAAAAARTAKKTAEGELDSMSGKVTTISVAANALSNIRSAISGFLDRNPITAWIKANVTKHAEGGFTYREQLSWLSEGNQPEVVIPLSSAKRSRAMELYQETGERLGVAQPTIATMEIPDNSVNNNVNVRFDADKLYAAVAAGARQGIESGNISIYVGEREVGRVMRGMGVQFA